MCEGGTWKRKTCANALLGRTLRTRRGLSNYLHEHMVFRRVVFVEILNDSNF
jgi:hypothetical protein